MMQRRTKTILDELDTYVPRRDISNLVSTRAVHIIQSAINLMDMIKENFTSEEAEELERKLLVAIKASEPEKFTRALGRINAK